MMPRRSKFVLFVVLLAGVSLASLEIPATASLASHSGAAPIAQDGECEYAPAPESIVREFVTAVRASPTFIAASSLTPERLKPFILEWQEELSVRIELGEYPFLDSLITGESSPLAGKRYSVEEDYREVSPDRYETFILLTVEGEDAKQSYRLSDLSVLAQFRFQTVEALRVLHPLHRRLDRYTAQSQSLTFVVAELAEMAQIDYALDSGLADDTMITLDLRNRRISECLDIAAASAGWKVHYKDFARNRDVGVSSRSIGQDDVVDVLLSREILNLRYDLNIETPMDALHYLVRDAAEVKDSRLVLTVRPGRAVTSTTFNDGADD